MIAIAGGHGKIALRLTRRLSARGDTVLSLIRNPDHADDVRAQGRQPIVCDLERATAPEITEAVTGASGVVFAAGAGPGSGAEQVQSSGREWTIVRPGRLTDEPGSGRVRIDLEPFRGEIPRDDVAAVLDAVLQDPRAAHRTLYVNAGDAAVEVALAAVL